MVAGLGFAEEGLTLLHTPIGGQSQNDSYGNAGDGAEYGERDNCGSLPAHDVFYLTLKMSRGGMWREPCVSRGRDIYRSWLHRFVRLIHTASFSFPKFLVFPTFGAPHCD